MILKQLQEDCASPWFETSERVNGLSFLTPPDFLNVMVSRDSRQIASADDQTKKLFCIFREGPAFVEIRAAPVKKLSRMREKLAKYSPPHLRSKWPLAANILDPVRASVVCAGPSQILQVIIQALLK